MHFSFSLFDTCVYLNGIVKVSEYNANGFFFYPILHIYIFVNAIDSGNSTNNAIRLFLYIPIGLLNLLQQCVKNICNRLLKNVFNESFLESGNIPWKRKDICKYTSFCFALVSRNAAFQEFAKRFPWSVVIIRSTYRSVLLPTNTIGTL